ncbi:MAG: AzlD domain-containing protein [Candidatus Methylomirabilota bacterium]
MSPDLTYLGVTIVGMGIVTYAIRLSMVLLVGHAAVPPLLRRALRFVPPAVLAALILPDLLLPAAAPSAVNPRLLAGALAALVAWRSGSPLLAIGAGMTALWLLQAALSRW